MTIRLTRFGVGFSWLAFRAETLTCPWSRIDSHVQAQASLQVWKAAKEERGSCRLLYRNMNDGKAIYKAGKATPGGLAGCTLYLSQRHLGLICWWHCQQAPVFLALTCERPWKF